MIEQKHTRYCNVCGVLPSDMLYMTTIPVVFETVSVNSSVGEIFERKLRWRIESSAQPLSLKWWAVVAFLRDAINSGEIPIDIRSDIPVAFQEDFVCYVFTACLWNADNASGLLLETLFCCPTIYGVSRINQYLVMNYGQNFEFMKRYSSLHSYMCRSVAYWELFAKQSDVWQHVFNFEKITGLSREGNVDAKIILRFYPRQYVPRLLKKTNHVQLELFSDENTRRQLSEECSSSRPMKRKLQESGPYVCSTCAVFERAFYGPVMEVCRSRVNVRQIFYALNRVFFCVTCGASLALINREKKTNFVFLRNI